MLNQNGACHLVPGAKPGGNPVLNLVPFVLNLEAYMHELWPANPWK